MWDVELNQTFAIDVIGEIIIEEIFMYGYALLNFPF